MAEAASTEEEVAAKAVGLDAASTASMVAGRVRGYGQGRVGGGQAQGPPGPSPRWTTKATSTEDEVTAEAESTEEEVAAEVASTGKT